jgi:hypothetical protein
MQALNPISFQKGDFIKSVYDGKVYEVKDPDKKGMAKLREENSDRSEDWNSCNNPHFIKIPAQTQIQF